MDPELQCEWDSFVRSFHHFPLTFENSITQSNNKSMPIEVLDTTINEVIMIENNDDITEEEMNIPADGGDVGEFEFIEETNIFKSLFSYCTIFFILEKDPREVSSASSSLSNESLYKPDSMSDTSSSNSEPESNITEGDNIIVSNSVNADDADGSAQMTTVSTEENVPLQQPPRKRARKGRAQPDTWIVQKNQKLREQGLPYKSVNKGAKKARFDVDRNAREMGKACECMLSSKPKSRIKCRGFSLDERKKIFEDFWKVPWSEKKTSLRLLVLCSVPKDTKNRKNENSRRHNTLQFHLKKSDGGLIRVCKTMFLNTLGLREWMVLNCVVQNKDVADISVKKQSNRKLLTKKRTALVHEFLDSLPKVASHYCRKSTTWFYLESLWLSKKEVYRGYLQYCKEQNGQGYKFKRFDMIMEEKNIRIFKPRKDMCDTCIAHNEGNISDKEWTEHITLKDAARAEKEKAKQDPHKKYVFVMDQEAVLICPRTQASALYFRTKLQVHNFTMYNLKTQEGYCFIWDETQGGVDANEFTTIICTFISNLPLEKGDEVILFSDGCGYQNRNSTLANGLFNIAQLLGVTVAHKYLEKGHTQMECDSMHSAIENRMRRTDITIPSSYVTVAKLARPERPYVVESLEYSFFRDYEKAVNFYTSIRPGKKKGDPCVNDLRGLQYTPDNIFYKLSHDPVEEWKPLPQRRNSTMKPLPVKEVPVIYTSRLPITARKYKDLQAMKHVLPSDTHDYYNNLIYA